jgi:hypothetical protein
MVKLKICYQLTSSPILRLFLGNTLCNAVLTNEEDEMRKTRFSEEQITYAESRYISNIGMGYHRQAIPVAGLTTGIGKSSNEVSRI